MGRAAKIAIAIPKKNAAGCTNAKPIPATTRMRLNMMSYLSLLDGVIVRDIIDE